MKQPAEYVRISPDMPLPEISASASFKTVVIVEIPTPTGWQDAVSKWLVSSGCMYMMAWGIGCSSWDDSVDQANIEQFDFGEIPENKFVMTTWYENAPLSEVFWFAKNSATHPSTELNRTVLLHISEVDRGEELRATFSST